MMAKIDNLNSGQLAPFIRRIENLERALSLASSSVERGRMRFYDGSELLIQDSNLNVVGTATIRGTLRADGTIAFTGTLTQSGPSTFTGDTSFNGPTHIAGDFDVTGPTKLNGKTDIGGNTSVTGDLGVKGPLDVTGTMDIKGKSTLQNDLTVQSGGRIKVGANMTLNPATGGGTVEFTNGASVASSGTDLKMNASGAALSLGTQAVMTGGTSSMVMAGSSTTVTTPLFMVDRRIIASNLPAAPAGAEPNLYRNPSSGELMRIV